MTTLTRSSLLKKRLNLISLQTLLGTFMSLPEDYRSQFVAQLHNSLSGWTGSDVDEAVR